MTYILLIYRASAAGAKPSGLDEQATLHGHRALQTEASERGELHAVARLSESRDARTVKRVAGAHEITDGPFVETKEWLVGFYLLDCANEEEALARAKSICADDEHAIEVRPVTWRWKP
ncbi:MAG TPA: YciI family protein [Polyangiaceae bacterium]|nr:YciI family protein [Polyangiaceae bacterium]